MSEIANTMLRKITDDLAIIQKLDRYPNDADGLSAAELQAKFDEAALRIQTFLNGTLIPAIVAENISFKQSVSVPAETVQAAIENVQKQISSVSLGEIPNGTVTKQKLSKPLAELLDTLSNASEESASGIDELETKKAEKSASTSKMILSSAWSSNDGGFAAEIDVDWSIGENELVMLGNGASDAVARQMAEKGVRVDGYTDSEPKTLRFYAKGKPVVDIPITILILG